MEDREDGHQEATTDVNGPLSQVVRQEFWHNIAQFLDGLPPMEREVFALRFLDQLSITEIAQVMKRSESTVKTHLYRSTLKFKLSPTMTSFIEEA